MKGGVILILTEKLDYLLETRGMSKRSLATESGIPYTTIISLYTKGYGNAKLSTLKGISNFFNVTLDSLCRDELDELIYKTVSPDVMKSDEQKLLEDYRALNQQGKEHIRVCMCSALAVFKQNQNPESEQKEIDKEVEAYRLELESERKGGTSSPSDASGA